MVGVGLVGGAAYVLNRWLSRAREKIEQIAERQETGDLR
jgi:HAMP domain-containing protein